MDPTKKICSLCGSQKPIEAFHRRSHYSRDGHRAACKACTATEAKRARAARGAAVYSDEARKKDRVRKKTSLLIKSGKLIPRPCAVCGGLQVQAHHPGYDGPEAHTTVRWLCPLHHAQEHGVRGWTKQLGLFPEAPTPVATSPRAVTYEAQPAEDSADAPAPSVE